MLANEHQDLAEAENPMSFGAAVPNTCRREVFAGKFHLALPNVKSRENSAFARRRAAGERMRLRRWGGGIRIKIQRATRCAHQKFSNP